MQEKKKTLSIDLKRALVTTSFDYQSWVRIQSARQLDQD
jgi:leucyl-tRNA synthetase